METTIIDEQTYAKGFNHGVVIFQYEPDIAQSFIDNEIVVNDDFSEGLKQGLLHAQQEKTLSEFEQLRNQQNDLERDITR